MNTRTGLKKSSSLRQVEFQKAIFVLLGFMFLCQGLVSQGIVFVATMGIGVCLIVFAIINRVRS